MMLSVRHLSCAYGKKTVINDVSFTLDRGLHVLLGQNGSGKTTLFRALLGIVPPSCGEAELDGADILSLSPKKRARLISAVLGSHRTLSGITGQALVEMSLYAGSGPFRKPSRADCERIRLPAERMGAAHLLDKPLACISAGERQLLSLLAAEVQDTPLMLLDEPTSALDYNRTHEFMARARASAERKILLCTLHDPALALRYADRILLLADGCLVSDFAPREVTAVEAELLLRRIYPAIHVFPTETGFSIE